jgi:tRNA pseudouridine55 synthase
VAEGLLLVDKPAGMTSHDAVDVCRRAYAERSIGHLGTLDPFATGLLVLLCGRATRLATFIDTDPKVYEATVRFGSATDTGDVTGTAAPATALPVEAAVRRAAEMLTGAIEQLPPAYSAKQVGGMRAYAAARRGKPLALAPVLVQVHDWRFTAWRPADSANGRDGRDGTVAEVDVTVTCGAGTYLRTLAEDLGRHAGSSAHLSALRRVRAGVFDIADAHTLAALREQTPPPPLRALRVVADA